MKWKFLLDTNIISEPARPIPNANILHKLDIHKSEVVVSSVVVHEILHGCLRLSESKRRESLWNYIHESILNLPVFDYDLKAAQWHAQERARLSKIGKTPAFVDAQIASIAYSNNLILVTNNVSDFEFFNDLRVENWFVK
ncbi:VapC toxin family PIN domain ribonuclease [Brasilonema octagenarum UFV-E1]|uniref:VapC toxin family PIN domain ribonuclease n=2 Tax=Brasilonema TaxID=383614 RepID=A0A856MQZ2_9CYAN|nr:MULTISPECIES: type II toxin-antitoxin system VapC family toxin [Brasilonema]NMF66430.1 VapC toxin family PIN domain ribonuclease [Brasilonema octagenarum UFV-OR1]QDL11857.1 VapC toxin family PIN domain ribonuclease [Brasilonema sennae CENA114]QDL18236.1 VapC toxin family PIN domain ribonuclease [Brasilonema octagenarum UFV-E1]